MKIKAIEKNTLVDRVEESILEIIRDNNLQIGDKLPSELELTNQLGVSRTVIREALSRFRMLGMVESRKKRGLVLTEPDIFGGFQQVLEAALTNSETRQDLFEMRLMLEIGLADLVFQRKTDEDIEKLEDIVSKLEKSTNDPSTEVALDIEFHAELYRISGNRLLQRFQNMLLPFFIDAMENYPIKAKASHRDLLTALKSGTPDKFRKIMKKHLENYFKDLV